ncbi:unnamed protein product [Victoria cruziana]
MEEQDVSSVCCMCGDIGFPSKLFLCIRCCNRYQHSYCSNYYNEQGTSTVCDWCQSEERSGSRTFCWTKLEKKDDGSLSRYVNSSKNHNMENHDKGKNLVASSSSRPANRSGISFLGCVFH